MSIRSEYNIYRQSGGTLSEAAYTEQLDHVRTTIGQLINNDPQNHRSDIGKKIFDHLKNDISSAVAFSKVSKGLYERAKLSWFATNSREIVLKYIKHKTNYLDYIKVGGWKDFIIVAAKVTGISLTISAGIKAGLHASRIPKDAPKKTVTVVDEETGVSHEVTYIDHPEAKKAENWQAVTLLSGSITVVGVVIHGIHSLLKDIDLDLFFSTVERDIAGSPNANLGLKFISPDFQEWKMTKMKENLTSNPKGWQQNPTLSQMICPISGDFMLFPVIDACGHYFDFRSIRGYQLNPATTHPLECPIASVKPNSGLATIKFDKAKFDLIQRSM